MLRVCRLHVAFEELERALGMAQRAEEARRQLQDCMEEQVKQVEQASEEERRSLQQELTRVKQEVITIMKVLVFSKTISDTGFCKDVWLA